MRALLVATLVVGCGDVAKPETPTTLCGDSKVTADEECDTGGESAGCNADCTRASCGDGQVNAMAGETCDDGDADDTNACNNACRSFGGGQFASTGAEGAFSPVADIVLPSGIHNFTTINIPAGVTVRTNGTGQLELYATGDIVVDGTIDLSGGRGGDGGPGGVSGACGEGAGAGGSTGIAVRAADGVGACGGAPGLGGAIGVAGLTGQTQGCPPNGGDRGGGGGGGGCGGGGGGGGVAGGSGGSSYFGPYIGGNGAGVLGSIAAITPTPDGNGSTGSSRAGSGAFGHGAYLGTNGTLVASCRADGRAGASGGGGAIGPFAESDLAVAATFYPGSGGGGGGGPCVSCSTERGSGGGGGGGGALRLVSPTAVRIGASGKLLANGGNGGDGVLVNDVGSSGGGGGSGGVVYVAAPSVTVASGAILSAAGGIGGISHPTNCGIGGNGGLGRIRISAGATCTLSGTFTPSLANGCMPTSMAEKTYVATYPN